MHFWVRILLVAGMALAGAVLAALGILFLAGLAGLAILFYLALKIRRFFSKPRSPSRTFRHQGIDVEVIPPPREERES